MVTMSGFSRNRGDRSPTQKLLAAALLVVATSGTAWSGEIADRLSHITDAKTFARLLGDSREEAAIAAKPFTLFVPVDSAFAKLPSGALASLTGPGNADRLRRFVLFHAVPRAYAESDLSGKEMDVTTIAGGTLDVDADDGPIVIDKATVIGEEISLPNGVIHLVDRVLVPH